MKDFYREREGYNPFWTHEEYMKNKREKVIEVIKPICEAFGIHEYDYEVVRGYPSESLVVEGQRIGCASNSVGAVVMELIGYIFVNTYAKNRSLGEFEKQTLNVLKRYWFRGEK